MKYNQTDSLESVSLSSFQTVSKPSSISAGSESRCHYWRWCDYACVWSGIVICVSGYSLGALLVIKLGLTIQQALLVLCLCGFVAFLISLLTAAPGFQHRSSTFPILSNIFGKKGVFIPVTVRIIVCCGWLGIHGLFGGMTINLIFCSVFSFWSQLGGIGEVIGYMLFMYLNLIFFRHGFESVRRLQKICAPLLVAVGVGLLVWANSKISLSGLWVVQKEPASVESLFEAALIVSASWFSFTFFMSDFSRYSQRKIDYQLGQFLGFYLSKLLFGGFGVMLGAASVELIGSQNFDMVSLINAVEQPAWKLMALVMVFLATLTTTIAACLATSSLDLESLLKRTLKNHKSAATLAVAIATIVALPELLLKAGVIEYGGLITLFVSFLKVYSGIINGLIVIFLLHYYLFDKNCNDLSSWLNGDFNIAACALSVMLIIATMAPYALEVDNFICRCSGFTNILVAVVSYGLFILIYKTKYSFCSG